jgi:hypothetical protein
MENILRILRLLAIVLWVGSLLFFAFVLAPVAFHVLPSTHEAGLVVGGTLAVLHRLGMISGAIFLVATCVLLARSARRAVYFAEIALVVLMLGITAYLQYSVLPAMERDRSAAGGDVDAAPSDNPGRLDFERLHPLSEKFEGAALFAGLGIVVLLAIERPGPRAIHS